MMRTTVTALSAIAVPVELCPLRRAPTTGLRLPESSLGELPRNPLYLPVLFPARNPHHRHCSAVAPPWSRRLRRAHAAGPLCAPSRSAARAPGSPGPPGRGVPLLRHRPATAGPERRAPPRLCHAATADFPACALALPRTHPGRGLAAAQSGQAAAATATPGRARPKQGRGAGLGSLTCGARLSAPLNVFFLFVLFQLRFHNCIIIHRKMRKIPNKFC